MGEERTERATGKKRRDTRRKGQVRKSTEVNTVFCLLVMFSVLRMVGPYFVEKSADVFFCFINFEYMNRDLNYATVLALFLDASWAFAIVILPILPTAMIAGVTINLIQVGFLYTTQTIKFKLSAINPVSGMKRLFSTRALMELLKAVLKVAILGYIVYKEYSKALLYFPNMIFYDIAQSVKVIYDTTMTIAFQTGVALVFMAALDFFYQWWRYEKDIRMTKQEVKEEFKQAEGDPKIKGKIRQKQQQLAMMRMMQAVPQADVVITNPTHYAVALKYDENTSAAPVVIAKGKDYVALRIKEQAQAYDIHIVEDKMLARSLYAVCEIGDQIPETLYQAVAEILAYVMRMRRGMERAGVR